MAKAGKQHQVWVRFEEQVAPPSDLNDQVVSGWQTRRTCRVSIAPRSAAEVLEAEQRHEQITHVVTCRWFPDLKATWRIVVIGRNRILHIAQIINDLDKNKHLSLLCTERPSMEPISLFANQTVDGNGSNAEVTGAGLFSLVIWGTLDGTITLAYSPDSGTNWTNIVQKTATGADVVYVPEGTVRAELSGETASDVSVTLYPVVGSWI